MPNETADPGVRARLEDAARGLLYTSESDYPFDFVSVPKPAGDLTAAAFASAVGAAPGAPAEEQSLDAFFARHIERAPAEDPALQALRPKYEALRDELRRSLANVRVFRVGGPDVQCYAVGDDGRGHLSGIHTVSIET